MKKKEGGKEGAFLFLFVSVFLIIVFHFGKNLLKPRQISTFADIVISGLDKLRTL